MSWRHRTGILLCMGLLLVLGGCSDDREDGREQTTRELRLTLGTQQYDMTRGSGDLPADFENYDYATALAPITQIQTYLTYLKDGQNRYVPSNFSYKLNGTAHTWVSKVALEDGQYYLYGFMPKIESEGSITITPYNNDFSQGAVLTFIDLNAVIPDDICVIVGAEGYGSTSKPTVPDMSSRLGHFGYHTADGDILFLLVDHLYAGIQFNMRMGSKYSQLRSIKVRSIKLVPKDGDNDVVETVNATVTIVANDTQTSPVSVSFVTGKTGTNPKPAALYEGEKELTTDWQRFLACFCPLTNKKFVLETTYDVYDKNENLIRKGETARNAIALQMDMEAGKLHTVNITVEPTYLYVLSEPDLDNPTFSVEN